MPSKQSLGRDDGGDITKRPTTNKFRLRRQAPPLVVVQTKPLAIELLAEHSILFAQVLNRVTLLPAIQPASEPGNGPSQRQTVEIADARNAGTIEILALLALPSLASLSGT